MDLLIFRCNRVLKSINEKVYGKVLSNEQKDFFKQKTTNKISKILKLDGNEDPVSLYNKLSDSLSNYLFGSSYVLLPRELINGGDSLEIICKKTRINEEFDKFEENAKQNLTRIEALELREKTVDTILEIKGISTDHFKIFTQLDMEIWKIIYIYGYTFYPKHVVYINSYDSEDIRQYKHKINHDLEMLSRGLDLVFFDNYELSYIYKKFLEKYNSNRISTSVIKILLYEILWGSEDFTIYDVNENTIEFTEDQLDLLIDLELEPNQDIDIDILSYYNHSETEPDTESIVNFEEDQFTETIKSILPPPSSPFLHSSSKESFITLEEYTEKDMTSLLSFYVLNEKTNKYNNIPSCITKDELFKSVILDFEEEVPCSVMSIYTQPKNKKDYLTGLTGKPTSRVFVKIPYKFDESLCIYITLGSFIKTMNNPKQEWFALPLFGGTRKRLGNLLGIFGQGMNHGQIPGYKVYKLYSREELNTKSFNVEEDRYDYPMTLNFNLNTSFKSQMDEVNLVNIIFNTIYDSI